MGSLAASEDTVTGGGFSDGFDDLADKGRLSAEKWNCWLRRNITNFANSYLKGEIHVVVNLGPSWSDEKYHFLLSAIPNGRHDKPRDGAAL